MKIRAILIALLMLPAAALAQVPQINLPPNTVIGRGSNGSGPAQAISFSQLLSAMQAGTFTAASINATTVNTNSVVYRGATSGQATVSAQAVAGTPAIKWPTTSGTVADNATAPIVLNATTGNISCPGCLTVASATPVLTSRAFASIQNLTGVFGIKTLGYTNPGDGGGATFKNVGSAAFVDTYITGATISAAGSGYVNGTYLGVPLGGSSTGLGCSASMTVAGGVVTGVSIVIPCAGYQVGDVLSSPNAFLGGSGSGFSYTVNSISTPVASFTDSAGNHFQYVVDDGSMANVLQFGAKGDWNGTDGTATNNSVAFWSAAAWASYPVGSASAQVYGSQIMVPKGAFMTCGAASFGGGAVPYYLTAPAGVRFTGLGIGGSTLVECAADGSSFHYIQLCDSNYNVGQFGCKFEKMTINASQVPGSTAGVAVIYSNSGQQFALGENLEIDAGNRGCIKYEIGKGGAANDIWIGIDCNQLPTAGSAGFDLNASSTQHIIRDSLIASSGAGGSPLAIKHTNGRLIVDGLDIEAYVVGLSQNVSTSGNNSVYRNVQQNSNSCTTAIQLLSANTPGNILFENVATACPTTIVNGQSGGTSFTGNIVKPITCVSGACN
ncbi:hypothetical protein [Bradyrhizobium diazoefficiens]|uniref:hypothetical protein n=1 Tax=Bradyrhizobium diazoefficiens TaxID=1355477 RepID=UPI002714899D|nr:hypothetical protein [Bradyrhizobium diazoefficiens]WLA53191.1 hypothetical protein QIH81_21630 [Bradyrhizobium diazoefficiens]